MKRHFSTKSMRFRITTTMVVIVASLACLLVGSNFYAIRVIRGQVYTTYQTTMNIYMQSLEADLGDAEMFLQSIAGDSSNLLLIKRHSDDWSLAAGREQRRLSTATFAHSTVDGFFIYEPQTGIWLDGTQANYSNARRLAVRNFISAELADETFFSSMRSWEALQVDDEFVFFRIIRLQGCYIGAWVRAERLTRGFAADGYSNIGYVFMSDADGLPLVLEPDLEGLTLDPASAASHYQLAESSDRWLMVAQSNSRQSYYLVVLVRDNSILEGLDSFSVLLVVIIACVAAAILLLLYAMRNFLAKPLKSLTCAMQNLQAGDWSAHVPVLDVLDEFVEVNATFNHMVDKIEDLKIGMYEQELAKQALEMQMLKQQLTPHTFVNCLNTIHGLAGTGEMALVQQMAEDLSRHLRYILSSSQTVPLSQELEHIRNYIALSALRFRDSVQLVEKIDEKALDGHVPPLLIQTFVENTVKYEVVPSRKTQIHVEIALAGAFLQIRMWDTGEGYSQEVLSQLALPVQSLGSVSGKGIGLSNLRQRIALLYGRDKVQIRFSNREGAGAQMDIQIPYIVQWGANSEHTAG